MTVLGSVLPISQQFLDSLSALDSIVLQDSLLVDFSIIATIPKNVIGESSYGDITVSVLINRFEATASIASEAFSLELPIILPSGPEIINFELTNASFSMDVFVRALDPIDIVQLFSDNQNITSDSLEYGGSFEAYLPLNVGLADVNTVVDFNISNLNLFEEYVVVDYAINMCDLSGTITSLFDQMKLNIVTAVRVPFDDKPVTFDVDRLLG